MARHSKANNLDGGAALRNGCGFLTPGLEARWKKPQSPMLDHAAVESRHRQEADREMARPPGQRPAHIGHTEVFGGDDAEYEQQQLARLATTRAVSMPAVEKRCSTDKMTVNSGV
jgi:hypothetical protein